MQILAGKFKGRKLLPPRGRGTRPITAALKKSLFGTLGEGLDGCRVADLYCGTGTLGLEALSRGAETCFFAERDRGALAALRRNIAELGVADRSRIWSGDLLASARRRLAAAGELDVAFLDPPFADARRWDWADVTARLISPLAETLAPDGVVALRVPTKVAVPETLSRLRVRRTKQFGGTVLVLLEL